MISLSDYDGREQAYVKHTFLARYLEALTHKTASHYQHIVYVDGFAGPWQSANEAFQDTSFGIALNALTKAKASWKSRHEVRMSAFLVERDTAAYERLASVSVHYPDVSVATYKGSFIQALPQILRDIPPEAFVFFFIDPKGWRIPLRELKALLARPNSEVIFNFMFDFINRAASIRDTAIVNALDELMPFGDFRAKLASVAAYDPSISNQRKRVLIDAFTESLTRLGQFKYVAETTVLRPLMDRPLYCLFYATRHIKGIEVFRDCQVKALIEQSRLRAASKVRHSAHSSGQTEFFQSLHDMGPDELTALLANEAAAAKEALLSLSPAAPQSIRYEQLWPQILARHIVRLPDINRLAAQMRREGLLIFPNWKKGKRVPQSFDRVHRS